jgi:hypothetical protein
VSCRHDVYQRHVGEGLQGLVVTACVLRAVKNVYHGWSVRLRNSWEDVTLNKTPASYERSIVSDVARELWVGLPIYIYIGDYDPSFRILLNHPCYYSPSDAIRRYSPTSWAVDTALTYFTWIWKMRIGFSTHVRLEHWWWNLPAKAQQLRKCA